jgi:diadenosine tetraphosphate (Ap4A) HIT family hydrolase
MPGGAVYEDDLVYAGHAAIPGGQATAYLGALLVEPRRHIPGLADLTDREAQRVGLLVARLSRALRVPNTSTCLCWAIRCPTCTSGSCPATPAPRRNTGEHA